jgi:RNA polymerase sigma factor (TIGR02999 family)
MTIGIVWYKWRNPADNHDITVRWPEEATLAGLDSGRTGAEGEVTALLTRLRSGDQHTLSQLIELIYPELRRIAQRHFHQEKPGHVLQPTALVAEAYLRLVAHRDHRWENRAHFFGAASLLMRRILVDHARVRDAVKRQERSAIESPDGTANRCESHVVDLIALDAALDELEQHARRQARIVQLRYFGGLSVAEVAEVLQLTSRTVDRDWAAARAWLRRRLQA